MNAVLILALATLGFCQEASTVGKRPYEMDWAGRTQDDHPPLVDFQDLTGWQAQVQSSVAKLERTREQQLFGTYVAKLTYRGTGPGPQVRLTPPQPIPITQPFDAVTLWVYGNNWGYAPDPATPQVGVTVLFEDARGQEFGVHLYNVDWEEWNLLHRRLTPEEIERVKAGAKLKGILITGGRNKEDRVLFLNSLCVYVEQFPPLKFEPRPERGIPMFPGQTVGTNTGPGKLPFPTRAETILPDNAVKDFKTSLTLADDGSLLGGTDYVFTYEGSDGKLTWVVYPRTGTFGDIWVDWAGRGGVILPCVGGGVYLQTPQGVMAPEKAESLGTRREGEAVVSRWRLSAGGVSTEATFTYRLWGKSLVVDVVAPGGNVAEVRYGRARQLDHPRLVTNPFYPASGGRPAVVVSGPPDAPLFLTGNTDWYLSNASEPFAGNAIDDQGVLYNGGTRYLPKTDGKRNDCYERLFLTLSPRYEEMLPTIPNPKSPWMGVTGTHVWRAHGASNRDYDATFWRDCHRWGMTQVVITDHETGWRDGGESFTFRTRPAPGKGGDEGQFKYARIMQDELGFVYGPYNNYTDFAPVNEYWSTDLIARTPDNQLQHAWMRCYAPKPARAVEYCARLAPIIQGKFHFSTAYCDVHTAVAPWHRVDYDARVPGAGTFTAVFYSYGEIMLHQKKAWNGPVYSEGNHHCFYSGLTDGNYGQDQVYRPAVNPWLVDFDLRKMHPLCCNFGMGAPDMFYAGAAPPQRTREEQDAWLDRFLAATVAFGHPGFLVFDGGTQNALRSYYMLQQLHSRYCLATAQEIRYGSAAGTLLDTSAAVASGAYARSQVVTRYSDGTITAANGSPTERMGVTAYGRRVDLPPNGYQGWTEDGKVEVFSGDQRGGRADYAASPAYLYVDGRGRMARFDRAAGNGMGICRFLPEGKCEVILWQNADCGFAVKAAGAVAVAKENKELGPAALRVSRGLTYVVPVKGAFSYLLTPGEPAPAVTLTCARDSLMPGETVTVTGREAHPFHVPADAKPGDRLWQQYEGAWIDFTVVPLTDAGLSLDRNTLTLRFLSNRDREADFTVSVGDRVSRLRAAPGAPTTLTVDLGPPQQESAEILKVRIQSDELVQVLERGLRADPGYLKLADLPAAYKSGMCLRHQAEQFSFGDTGAIVAPQGNISCGEVLKSGLFMHPPWMHGVGYSFALYDPVTLPANPPAAFRAVVGKADGSDPGDGILFKLAVVEPGGKTTVAGERLVTNHEWLPLEADLSPWAGKTVQIKLISDVGVNDDSSGDWSCWAEMRVESRDRMLIRMLDEDSERCRREPGPFPVANLTVADLRGARRGRLHYDGLGLEGDSPTYGSFAVLNGINLGTMTPAGGDEVHGKWAQDVTVALTPEAIMTLGARNRFVLLNPKQDWFAIRRLWLELELADGRKCSSEVSSAAYTQPPGWPYAQGILVPFEENVQVDLWFKLAGR